MTNTLLRFFPQDTYTDPRSGTWLLQDSPAIARLMLASRGRNPQVRQVAQEGLYQLGYFFN